MSGWSVDGISLDDAGGRWFVERGTNVPAPAQRRVSALELPNLDGVIVRRQGWGSGTVVLSMVITSDGAPVDMNADVLLALFARARLVSRRMSDGSVRSVEVVRRSVSEPNRVGVAVWTVEAQFETQPFWQEGSPALAPALPIGVALFSRWAGTTGDIQDGIVRVKGPAASVLIVASDGSGVSFEHMLTASQYFFVDVKAFRAWRGGASAWVPTANRVRLDYPPAGALRLTPDSDGLRLTVSGNGFTGDSSIAVRGSKWWL